MVRLPSIRVMQNAFARKDPAFDGTFFAAVKTTGVFCRPVCRAKPARGGNLEVFAAARAAPGGGVRACQLCKPPGGPHPPPLVQRFVRLGRQKTGPGSGGEPRAIG